MPTLFNHCLSYKTYGAQTNPFDLFCLINPLVCWQIISYSLFVLSDLVLRQTPFISCLTCQTLCLDKPIFFLVCLVRPYAQTNLSIYYLSYQTLCLDKPFSIFFVLIDLVLRQTSLVCLIIPRAQAKCLLLLCLPYQSSCLGKPPSFALFALSVLVLRQTLLFCFVCLISPCAQASSFFIHYLSCQTLCLDKPLSILFVLSGLVLRQTFLYLICLIRPCAQTQISLSCLSYQILGLDKALLILFVLSDLGLGQTFFSCIICPVRPRAQANILFVSLAIPSIG